MHQIVPQIRHVAESLRDENYNRVIEDLVLPVMSDPSFTSMSKVWREVRSLCIEIKTSIATIDTQIANFVGRRTKAAIRQIISENRTTETEEDEVSIQF